mgnify:CR=1 FL=1
MNNKDMPAMPSGLVDEDVFNSDGEFCGTVEARYVGLSKREHFAGLAMQGLLSSTLFTVSASPEYWLKDTVEASVEFSDALLAELDKPIE